MRFPRSACRDWGPAVLRFDKEQSGSGQRTPGTGNEVRRRRRISCCPTWPAWCRDGGRIERRGLRLDSVYFDTETHDLLGRGVTLRCRTGTSDEGWQLKVPTGDARTEIRLDPTGSQTTVPKELSTLVTGVRRGKALRHIVTVRTDRTAHRVLERRR